jgi:hypothetical protein
MLINAKYLGSIHAETLKRGLGRNSSWRATVPHRTDVAFCVKLNYNK